jgi:hypothetical protein
LEIGSMVLGAITGLAISYVIVFICFFIKGEK